MPCFLPACLYVHTCRSTASGVPHTKVWPKYGHGNFFQRHAWSTVICSMFFQLPFASTCPLTRCAADSQNGQEYPGIRHLWLFIQLPLVAGHTFLSPYSWCVTCNKMAVNCRWQPLFPAQFWSCCATEKTCEQAIFTSGIHSFDMHIHILQNDGITASNMHIKHTFVRASSWGVDSQVPILDTKPSPTLTVLYKRMRYAHVYAWIHFLHVCIHVLCMYTHAFIFLVEWCLLRSLHLYL
jgi:hypothetical protein